MKSTIFVFMFLCFAHITVADAQPQNTYLAKLIKQAMLQKLYQQPSWLALLHYNKKQAAQQFSFATSKRFFIAPDGRQNAEQELIATLHSLFQIQNEQQATPCKFPARYHWLKQSLSINVRKIAKQPVCQQYKTWRKQMKAQSVTLVFPGSYMNAPSSVFGHTLLRIDSSNNDPAHLLSHAISFAAKIPDGTGSFAYAMGGLNGTFPGRYQHALYHQKIKTYGRIENRDIWEYKLNLNPQEQERLLQHVWEIKDIDFRYFFAKENCSFRLLELLEVARTNSHLTDHFDKYAIPADTIRTLVKLGFVSSVKYRPSASTRLHAEINALNENEQAIALQISHHETTLASRGFVKLAENRKAKVIQLAYRYLKWKQLDSWRKQDNSLPYHLIQQLELHPVSTQTVITEPVRPDQGHATKRLKLSSGYEHKSYIQLGFRPLYHALTDNLSGYTPGSEIIFLNTELRWQQHSIHLHQLDILKMTSLRPSNAFLHPFSWRMAMGLYRSAFHSGYHLTPRISGAFGYSYQIMQHATLSVLPSLRINLNPLHTEQGIAQAGASVEYLAQQTWGTTYIQAAYYHALDKRFHTHQIAFLQTFAINKNQDFRVGAECKEKCRRNNINFNVGFAAFF